MPPHTNTTNTPTQSPRANTVSAQTAQTAPTAFYGLVADVIADEIFPGVVVVQNGRIAAVARDPSAPRDRILVPGFVDAHVHIESSLLTPAAFGHHACIHGTAATVSDPHEIANVLGTAGVLWMLENARQSPVRIHFGAPSCVPATPFETAGAALGPAEIETLLSRPEIKYLAEVMNYPGVIGGDPKMAAILAVAKRLGKRIDGHAPGLVGDALAQYAAAGIETDHECVTLDEARQRAALGMFTAIREGSAARNFDALVPLLRERPEMCFLCSDDKHPDDLLDGHINRLVARAVAAGVAPLDALRAATLNPARHYGLDTGLLQSGDRADFAVLTNLAEGRVLETWLGGKLVAKDGHCVLPAPAQIAPADCPNKFSRLPCREPDFAVSADATAATAQKIRVIGALDGQLITEALEMLPTVRDGKFVADVSRDLLKIAVVNRYSPDAPPAVGFIKNFGLRAGALASSVAHDSHNIVAVGADDASLCAAVNAVISRKGGLSFAAGGGAEPLVLPLPVAGLMSAGSCAEVGAAFTRLSAAAKTAGCPLRSPYMTLSFMALLVIPRLKLGDKGLFDVESFTSVGLAV
ncbi:MAG: adenine deaminase [Puniceicoccales bacterium]|jgi:adenine deaminase|nr:adenine deaminase [Puniceicoccales bacterium]